jgi:hypothetical protein
MRNGTRGSIIAAAGMLALVALALEPAPEMEVPQDVLVLVQSELDYLAAAERAITLEVERAVPAAVLEQIAARSGLVIDVRGTLPPKALLTSSFRDTKTKTVLAWFAEQVPVAFKAEPPNRLLVIVKDGRPQAP